MIEKLNNKFMLPLNLQHFAEGEGENGEGEKGKDDTNKTFTQEEVLALIQSEADKRVTQALQKQKRDYEKEIAKQKSLSGLDAEERAKAESQNKIAELEEQLSQFRLSNTKAEISKVLSARGMSAELVDYVVTTEDVEECQAKIEKLDKLFKKMVAEEVTKRLGSTTPKTSTLGLDGQITKEQYSKMTVTEKRHLCENNRELWEALTK